MCVCVCVCGWLTLSSSSILHTYPSLFFSLHPCNFDKGKSPITCVHYDLTAAAGAKTFVFPAEDIPTSTTASWHGIDRGSAPEYHPSIVERRSRRGRRWRGGLAASQLDAAVSRRSYIYRHGLYSRYVGNNDISRYREITPEVFNREPRLVSRAQRWIRRELQAFTFPYGSGFGESHATSVTAVGVPPPSYAGNPEFLLEYIIAILRTVDIRGAAGHAETLLCSYFGGPDNTRLFLHELNSFLRSPFSDLRQWDEAVQYGEHIPTSRRDEEARLRRL